MTVLLSAPRNVASGSSQSPDFAISGAIKRAGFPLQVTLRMEAEPFPNGTTTIDVSLSTDNGATWKTATMTVVMPHTFKGPAPHYWTMSFNLDKDQSPTHARFRTVAPSAFTTNVILEAV